MKNQLQFNNIYHYENIGPPGAGKSTTAQLLARNHGFIYYEADAFFMMCNPFNDINVDNPSMSTIKQKPLKVNELFFVTIIH